MAVQLPEGEDTNEWLAVHGAYHTQTYIGCAFGDDGHHSGGFFQPSEYVVWDSNRVLHSSRSSCSTLSARSRFILIAVCPVS